jgi:hypothetical protein
MKRFIMLVVVALLFGVTNARADYQIGYEEDLLGSWSLKVWENNKVWTGCSVDKVFTGPAGHKRSNLGFLLNQDSFQMALVFEEPVFFVSGTEQVEYAFRVDGDKIFRGTAAVEKQTAFLTLDWNLDIVREVQDGKKLEVKVGDSGYWFPLVGSRNALNKLMECYKYGLESLQRKQ